MGLFSVFSLAIALFVLGITPGPGMFATITVAIFLSSVLMFYAYLANRARVFFSSTRSVRRLNRTAGGVMIAAGVVVAADS